MLYEQWVSSCLLVSFLIEDEIHQIIGITQMRVVDLIKLFHINIHSAVNPCNGESLCGVMSFVNVDSTACAMMYKQCSTS